LPAVPSPEVEPRNETAAMQIGVQQVMGPDGLPRAVPSGPTWAELAQELVDLCFNSTGSEVPDVLDQLQWDDDRGGLAVLKTIWQVDAERAEPLLETDDDRAALAVEQAEAENMDPVRAAIQASDIDYIHITIHRDAIDGLRVQTLTSMQEEPPELAALVAHLNEHEARMVVIKRERATVERVPWWRYVYDPDVPWSKRGWESEERSIRIDDLLSMGCRNVNPENVKPEEKSGEADLPYEDKTARVFDIHDRREGKRFIIAAEGPEDGLFLLKEKWIWGGIDIYQPFVTRPYKPDQLHGIASIQACLPILDQLAEVDFSIARHVETHASYKKGLPKGTDPSIKSQLKNPDTMFFDVDAKMAAMGNVDYAPPPIPVTLLQQRDTLIGELRRMLGIDAQDTGAPQQQETTATESFHRAQVKEEKKDDRQGKMGHLLSRIARNFLMLYKKFASQKVMVRVLGPEGARFYRVAPGDIPDDLDAYFDIQSQTESEKAETRAKWQQILTVAGSIPVAMDWQEIWEGFLRAMGIRHPERYRAEMGDMQGAQTGQMPGAPGVPGDQTIPFPGNQGNQGGQPYSPPEQQAGLVGA